MTRSMIEEWLSEQDDISHNRRVAYARNLHIAFNYAVDRDWIDKIPAAPSSAVPKAWVRLNFFGCRSRAPPSGGSH